jgi:hypothetical protein
LKSLTDQSPRYATPTLLASLSTVVSNRSGGVDFTASQIDIGGDVVGGDKITNMIVHAGTVTATAIYANTVHANTVIIQVVYQK